MLAPCAVRQYATVHMLDIECFSFLNRALENDMAPVLVVGQRSLHLKAKLERGLSCSSSFKR